MDEFGNIHPCESNTVDNTTWMKSHGWELENSFIKNRLINFQHVKDETYLRLRVSVSIVSVMSSSLIWQCNLCGAHGEGKESEITHKLSHTENPCVCGERMSFSHLTFNHFHVEYSCDRCTVRLKTKASMELHVQRHKNRK